MKFNSPWKIALIASVPLLLGAVSITGDTVGSNYTRLSLNGVGYDSQPASYVEIRASTQTWSSKPSSAMSQNAATMKRLRSKLRWLGVAEDDFRTASFQFTKQRDPNDRSSDRDDGYAVNHALSITVRDAEKAGEVMDALVAAGADGLQVGTGYGYSQEVRPQSIERARKAAIKDAQEKANDYAAALGMKVRRIVEMRDGSTYATNRPRMHTADLAFAAAQTKVDTRDQMVQASVAVIFELE